MMNDVHQIISKGPYEGGGGKVQWWRDLESANLTTIFTSK
jgi:hypothetical protein